VSWDVEAKLQVVLLGVSAVALLVLAGWCLRRTALGRSATLGFAGAGLLGISLGLPAASSVELFFFDSFTIANEVLIHRHVGLALSLAQAAGAILLAAAFVEQRRAASKPAESIYGP
jgi:hypothetical protein